MHPNNRYRAKHDFAALAMVAPELKQYFIRTPDGRTSLDFTQPGAVLQLNRALLLRDYGLKFWDIPNGSLCPGVPGRLDYIHVIADLLEGEARPQVQSLFGSDARPQDLRGIDVGTGVSLIYPILGVGEYGWGFLGTDIDATSLKVAGAIARFNPVLKGKITLRQQPDRQAIFRNVIRPGEHYAFSMANPPFFADAAGASNAARQKWEKLGNDQDTGYNFGGRPNELWTPGGEPAFLRRMILESRDFAGQVGVFTTLVSKKGYLHAARQLLERMEVAFVNVISIGQGGKIRRVLAWGF